MSRKNPLTNLENEEILISSPVRRSSRLLNNSAAAAGITTRRGSQSSETSEPPTTRTSARTRRISVDEAAETKNNQVKNNAEAKTPTRRGRKSSVSSETSEKPKTTTTRARRNSASQDSSEAEPKVAAPKTPSRITRRKTSTDSDISVEIGNSTRSKAIQAEKVKKSSQEISDTEYLPKPATVRKGRRFSNDENISTPTKTPVRRSRRLSSNTEIETEDNNQIIASIDLTNTDTNEDENLNQELSANKLTTPYKKNKIVGVDLDLSVINESIGDLNETSLTKNGTDEASSVQKNEDVEKSADKLVVDIQDVELKSSAVPISPKKRLQPDHVDDNTAEYSPKKSPRIDDVVKRSTPNKSTINLIESDIIQSPNSPTILEINNLEEHDSSNKENIEDDTNDKIIISDAPLSPIIGRSARISNVFKPNQKECSFVVEPMEVDDCSSILAENDNSVYKLDQSVKPNINSTITSSVSGNNDTVNKISSSLLNKRVSLLTDDEENKLLESTINNDTESSDDFILEETEEKVDLNVKAAAINRTVANILINKESIIIKHNVTGKTSSPLLNVNKLAAAAGRRSYEKTNSNNEGKTCNKTLSVINCSIKSKSANSSPSEEFKQHLSRLSAITGNTDASTTEINKKIESNNQIIDLTSSSENSLDDNILLNNTKIQTPDKSPSSNSSQHQLLEKSSFYLKLSQSASVDYDFELPSEEEINDTTNNSKTNVTFETSKQNLKDLSLSLGSKLNSLQNSSPSDISNTKEDATLDNADKIQNISLNEKSEVTPLKKQSLIEENLLNKSNDEIIIEINANDHQQEEETLVSPEVSPLKNQSLLLEENLLNKSNEIGIIVNQAIEKTAEAADHLKEQTLIEENVTKVENKEAEISLQHSIENKATDEVEADNNIKESESLIQQTSEIQNDKIEENNINKSIDELKNNTEDREHNKSKSNNPTITEAAATNDHNDQEEDDSDSDDDDNNKKIVETDSTSTKLSEYIKSKSKELESSTTEEEIDESSESENEYNEFIDGMAEEGEEDTPSEDSNQISEEGESIGSSDSEEAIEDDYDDNDSFICDDEDVKLLSGEGDDLSFERQKKSRIINLKTLMMDDSDDEIIPNPNSKDEVEIILPKKTKTITVLENSPSSKTQLSQSPTKNEEKEENVHNNSLVEAQSETNQKISAIDPETCQDVPNVLDSSNTAALNASLQKKNRKASLTIQENILLDGIKDPKVGQRINDMVASFCSSVKTGEMSLNISLEYEGSAAAETVDEVLNTIKLDSSTSSVDAELIMHSEVVPVENSSNISSENQQTSSSVIQTDSQEKQKNKLKRKLNKSVSEVYEEQKFSKKSKKSKNKAKTLSNDDGAENLGTQSYNLIDQLVTDVKNRPKRKLKPSISNPQLNIPWNISSNANDDLKPSKCCTSREERIRVNTSSSIKLHPKDFKNKTLADSSRVKRIDTKTLLKRKGVYGKFM